MTTRPPTLRNKWRYILVRILPGGQLVDQKDLYFSVHEAVTSLWGDAVATLVQPAVMSTEGEHAIVRCRRGMERELAIALSVVPSCSGRHIALRTVTTSATIESLRKRIAEIQEGKKTVGAVGSECTFDHRVWVISYCEGQKVDVIEKGFKNATRFYLTTEDLEDN